MIKVHVIDLSDVLFTQAHIVINKFIENVHSSGGYVCKIDYLTTEKGYLRGAIIQYFPKFITQGDSDD